jgi:hypothetical protein
VPCRWGDRPARANVARHHEYRSHDDHHRRPLTTLKHCDRIVVFDNRRIREIGTYEELVARDGVFAKLVASAAECLSSGSHAVKFKSPALEAAPTCSAGCATSPLATPARLCRRNTNRIFRNYMCLTSM